MKRDEFHPHPIKLFVLESIARFLPSCDVTTHTISSGIDRKLTLKEKILKRLHLSVCIWCTRYEKQVHLIHTAMHKRGDESEQIADQTKLSVEAMTQIEAALRSELDSDDAQP